MATEAKNFFTKEQKQEITLAISQAENNTSGEIRVHVENECRGDVLARAANVFEKLGMTKTELRNGVLVYLAVKSHKFAILGDQGINEKVPEHFWDEVRELMQGHFSRQEFAKGLAQGIQMAGLQLKAHFPLQADDQNELPDEISFG